MKIIIKGGVWKNSEDEILKAAVMKYGLNQWARVGSLLPRKTAKQCKARWYEWLDPSIKKTEWTREEEERLLHLAKLMPAQWRTIAPMVGRSAAQCLEHYEKLLDAAQASEGVVIDAKDDPRRLRPGEIDPAPEMKPARPDPVDMDEDEKEMLSEARARLANTKGKKAKRKARERQLEEARRLAALQKRRELRAAGVGGSGVKRRRVKGIDYATEVPFEKKAPIGYFDVSDDDAKLLAQRASETEQFRVKRLNQVEATRVSDLENRERAKDRDHRRKVSQGALPAVLAAEAEKDPLNLHKRARLVLPAPIMSESDLEAVVKLGQAAAAATGGSLSGSMIEDASELGSVATGALLADYRATVPGAGATPLLHHAPGSSVGPLAGKAHLNSNIALALSSLPEPKNTYEVTAPDVSAFAEEGDGIGGPTRETDEGELDEKRKAEEAALAEAELRRRSAALRHMPQLPRPVIINEDALAVAESGLSPGLSLASSLIREQMVARLKHDACKYPIPHKAFKKPKRETPLEPFTDDVLAYAKAAIDEEATHMKLEVAEESGVDPDADMYLATWDKVDESHVYLAATGSYVPRDRAPTHLSLEQKRAEFRALVEHLDKERARVSKIEQRVLTLTKGYEVRASACNAGLTEAAKSIAEKTIELACYSRLAADEAIALPVRMTMLAAEVGEAAEKERELQAKYARLIGQVEDLKKMLAAVEAA